ncbi:MAG: ABC transporter ATP-binding protein [Deltaproteobacteria bacterium]|nr:ABC transporter ATP-binding protein [Deltaproteobacteria bacterium]
MNILEMEEVCKSFGGLAAVTKLNFSLSSPQEILGLIGPNGAGKTTVFNLITGLHHPTNGKIRFKGQEIGGEKPYRIARQGISRTFQTTSLFFEETVLTNMLISRHCRLKSGLWGALAIPGATREEERKAFEKAGEILEDTGLGSKAKDYPHNLTNAEQRMLMIAMALATDPALILLDEPFAGMRHHETEVLMELVRKISGWGIATILIEHDMKVVMNICDRLVVLNFGTKIAEGTPDEIRTNPQVVEAYLGRRSHA